MATLTEKVVKEINNNWAADYSAIDHDGEARIMHKDTVFATVDNYGRMEVLEFGFDDEIETLSYYTGIF